MRHQFTLTGRSDFLFLALPDTACFEQTIPESDPTRTAWAAAAKMGMP
jgi:hypothetical protein